MGAEIKTTSGGGRPLKFKTPKELQAKVDEYFKTTGWQKKTVLTHKKKPIEIDVLEPATLTGLANALDVERQTLYNYKKRPKFFNILARAKGKCAENILHGGLMNQFNPKIAAMCMANEQKWNEEQKRLHGEDSENPLTSLQWDIKIMSKKNEQKE